MNAFQAIIAALGILGVAGIFGIALRTGASLGAAFLFSVLVVTIVGYVVGGARPL